MPPATLIERYFAAFSARNTADATALFERHGLFEFPFLRPRLVGTAEIRAGHDRAFAVVDRIAVTLRAVRSQGTTAIAEGRLQAHVARDGIDIDIPFAAVAEAASNETLARLSIYCDAHPFRLWTDGPVLAFDGAKAGAR